MKTKFHKTLFFEINVTLHFNPHDPLLLESPVPIPTFLSWLVYMINLQVHSALSLTFSGGWKNSKSSVATLLRPYRGGPHGPHLFIGG